MQRPWDLTTLARAPSYRWLEDKSQVRALIYSGEFYQGRPSEVFAYYATPGTLQSVADAEASLPGILLLHGGKGTAFVDWVRQWAGLGFAAIAIDLGGKSPEGHRLPLGGPPDSPASAKFDRLDEPVTEHWHYHAIANALLALSFLRDRVEVDWLRTAVMGVSWGGVLACTLAGLDSRLRAMVSIYGTGYLREAGYWNRRYFDKLTEQQREYYRTSYDPVNYLPNCSCPVLLVNGTNDEIFPLDLYERTCELISHELRTLRLVPELEHSHEAAWNLREPMAFVDYFVGRPRPFPLPILRRPFLELDTHGVERLFARYRTDVSLDSARLHFTLGTGAYENRRWLEAPARLGAQTVDAEAQRELTGAFFSITTREGLTATSEVVFPSA